MATYNPRNVAKITGLDNGGQVLMRPRVPTLAIEQQYPKGTFDSTIVWADGNTLYAIGKDNNIRKSVDGGQTWVDRTTFGLGFTMGYRGCFLKLPSDTLLCVRNSTPLQVYRSTDDGATWASVHTMRNTALLLTPQSWAVDQVTGYIYMIEYSLDNTLTEICITRSTDDGATWATWATFPGPASAAAGKIRHGHAVQWDSVSQRIYFAVGDGEPKSGIYRVNAAGNGVEAVVTNDQWSGYSNQFIYPIGLMFFPDFIAWGSDGMPGHIYRMARSQIGQPNPKIEAIYRMGGASWGSIRASADGSVWIATAASEAESQRLDGALHLFAVSNNGATVYELGCIGGMGGSYPALMAVGQAELHTDAFWFGTRGLPVEQQFKARLCRSTVQVATPERPPHVYGWQTINCPRMSVNANSAYVFAAIKVPVDAKKLYVFDAQVFRHSGTGTARIYLVRMDTNANIVNSSGGLRTGSTRKGSAPFISVTDLPGDTTLELRLGETAAAAVEASGYVTIGWGF